MRRIPPYIDCILHYLMETCGQITCSARTRGTIGGGTGGTIGGQHATPSMEGEIRPKGPFVGPSISAESANEADSALHRLHSSILSDGDLRSGRVHGEDARHNRRAQAARHLFYPLLGGGIAKRGGGLASTTPRFHPFLNAPTKLMETYGQIACTARTPAQSGSGGAQA